jgi:glutathione synthase/RimK-type ligase-like ATP-grasp enzyme
MDYLPWDDPEADWPAYDAVVLRTPWDYFRRPQEFLAWIDAREADGTNLWNPAGVCRWNADKRYLEELREAGIAVVPTAWIPRGSAAHPMDLMREHGWGRAVVKPGVSGGAYQTSVVDLKAGGELLVDPGAEVMVQPFLPEIEAEGEWSLMFFDGAYSHAALKRPARGEFRVQEKHGGTVDAVTAPPGLIRGAQRVLAQVKPDLLYARVDGVRRGSELILMELEVLEPALFFGQDPASPAKFVAALVERLRPPRGATPSSSPGTA